jgi:hypothetical protein
MAVLTREQMMSYADRIMARIMKDERIDVPARLLAAATAPIIIHMLADAVFEEQADK